ncbi:hypothetical protein COL154_007915 [Colletotrichum chrysophilum]|uniref:uncharacterized protein n=1 Tax=Colletotrichum chrysophilum TaxID=1836956 RepID=UPI0022FFCB52|nr:uncharacterized protein COL26b_010439 [Colletotrichum chrysophilum]KAJ0350506.1 hypothetical protein KNSL1_003908 [Colletotrichum chrysophilum]KAJ0359867.1 hypothetical protein COL154_007915 [Colletotrichum chrysophilum]KAJ0369450.1 hypothetical protein COL26b_010439 [Colletotrichum chrysophilum]
MRLESSLINPEAHPSNIRLADEEFPEYINKLHLPSLSRQHSNPRAEEPPTEDKYPLSQIAHVLPKIVIPHHGIIVLNEELL